MQTLRIPLVATQAQPAAYRLCKVPVPVLEQAEEGEGEKMKPKIDPEFRALIPPLTAEELAGLEADILEHGALRDNLVIWAKGNVLLDGHHRLAICERHGIGYATHTLDLPDRDAAKLWIIRNQFSRRNLATIQKIALSELARPLIEAEAKERQRLHGGTAPGREATLSPKSDEVLRTDDVLAEMAGCGRTTYRDALFVMDYGTPEQIEALKSNSVAISKAASEIKRERQRTEQRAALADAKAANKLRTDVCYIRHCSMADLFASGIKPDCIITDPPYPKEHLHLYAELAELAKNVPLVAVMCGQSYLPQIMEAMCRHLEYRWTLAYLTPGGQAVQQWQAKVNTFWKPVLLFGKAGESWIGDVCKSNVNDNDKRFHDWGQSESGMTSLVERLSTPGQLICDPFLGGGTTAVVALALGRRFVGCDTDGEAVKLAKGRCCERGT